MFLSMGIGLGIAIVLWSTATASRSDAARAQRAAACETISDTACVYQAQGTVGSYQRSCGRTGCTFYYDVFDDATATSARVTGEDCPCPMRKGDAVMARWWSGRLITFAAFGKTTRTDLDPGYRAETATSFAALAIWLAGAVSAGVWMLASRGIPIPAPEITLPLSLDGPLLQALGIAAYVCVGAAGAILVSPSSPTFIFFLGMVVAAGLVVYEASRRLHLDVEGIRQRSHRLYWRELRQVEYARFGRSNRLVLAGDGGSLTWSGAMPRRSAYRLLLAVRANAPSATISERAWGMVGPRLEPGLHPS